MAFSKANCYESSAQRFNELFRAISHPARQRILRQLNKDGSCTVKELCRGQPISKASLSYHLEILRTAHLVKWEEKYPYTYYELDWEVIEEAKALLIDFFDDFEKKDDGEDNQEGNTETPEEDEGLTDLD